jgi:uncharacterized protein (DUF302 family)
MMPCRISVYLKDDSKTYIALINTEELSDKMPGSIAKVMNAASKEAFDIVQSVII